MSALLYGALARKGEAAPWGRSIDDEPPAADRTRAHILSGLCSVAGQREGGAWLSP